MTPERPGTGARPLLDAEFRQLRDLIYRHTGIHLADTKKALLVGRLARRLRELELDSFGQYYQRVRENGDPEERRRLLEAICTHETHFFREPRQFEYVESQLLPEWERQAEEGLRPRVVRAWSAGCATGEEPYSLAMTLLSALGPDRGWHLEILATDFSTRALEKARAGVWPIAKAVEIPEAYRRAFMLKGTRSQEGLMKAGAQIRSVIHFAPHNLAEGAAPGRGPFDLIFCRNVLIYFDGASRARAIDRLISQLGPAGRLFLGHSESLNGVTNRLCSVGPTVYDWPPAGVPGRPPLVRPTPQVSR